MIDALNRNPLVGSGLTTPSWFTNDWLRAPPLQGCTFAFFRIWFASSPRSASMCRTVPIVIGESELRENEFHLSSTSADPLYFVPALDHSSAIASPSTEPLVAWWIAIKTLHHSSYPASGSSDSINARIARSFSSSKAGNQSFEAPPVGRNFSLSAGAAPLCINRSSTKAGVSSSSWSKGTISGTDNCLFVLGGAMMYEEPQRISIRSGCKLVSWPACTIFRLASWR